MSTDDKEDDDEVFDFYEQLAIGEKWEELLEPHLGSFVWQDAERISFDDKPELQRKGIDHVMKERKFSDDGLQTKAITKKYTNIFYETRHKMLDKPYEEWEGWVYEYNEKVILWVWLSDDQRRIVDARWLLIDDVFRTWFDFVKDNYDEKPGRKPSYKNGRKYYSYGVPIPLDDIHPGFIRPAHSPVGLKSNSEQTELINFDD